MKIIKHGTRNTYERHKCRCDECRAANAARHHHWVLSNRGRHRELANAAYANHRERHLPRKRQSHDPVKAKAHKLVRMALRDGVLSRDGCVVGGDCSGKIHAHHDDYGKPLDVRWLCERHHCLLHLGKLNVNA